MAHYDCDHCGSSMGIDYGDCDNCTPPWVKEAIEQYTQAVWDVDERIDEIFAVRQEQLDREKETIREELLQEAKEEFDLTFEAGKDWYKKQNCPDES